MGSMIDMTDLKFRALRRLKLSEPDENNPQEKTHMISNCSKFGLVFAAAGKQLITLSADDIRAFDDDGQQTRQPDVIDHGGRVTTLPGHAVCVKTSCDGLTVGVVCQTTGAVRLVLYDVRALNASNYVGPFMQVPLTSETGVSVTDLAFNPVSPNSLAVVLSNGKALLLEIKESSFVLSDAQGFNSCRCVCWSPKGKQLVIGHADGSLTQHKPDWTLAKKIPAPDAEQIKNITSGANCAGVEVLSIQWLSTFVFLVCYGSLTDSESYLCILNAPKNAPLIFKSFGDICYSSNSKRRRNFHLEPLREWGLILCSSANAVDVGVLGKLSLADPDDAMNHFCLDDSSRAEVPLGPNDEEHASLGLTLDFSSSRQIIIGENAFPPAPLLLLYTTSGLLCPYHVMYNKPDLPNVMIPREDLKATGNARPSQHPVSPAPSSLPPAAVVAPKPYFPPGSGNFSSPFAAPAKPNVTAATCGIANQLQAAMFPTSAVPVQVVQSPAVTEVKPSVAVVTAAEQEAKIAAREQKERDAAKELENQRRSEAAKCQLAIKEEIAMFSKELAKLQMNTSRSNFSVADQQEKILLETNTLALSKRMKVIEKLTADISDKIKDLQTSLLESFASIEDAEQLAFRNKDPRYMQLLELHSPGISLSKKIFALRGQRLYIHDQISLAQKALGQELLEIDVASRRLNSPGLESFQRRLHDNVDPRSLQSFAQKEKLILHNAATRLEMIRRRCDRLDPRGRGETAPVRVQMSPPATSKQSSRKPLMESNSWASAGGFKNAEEAKETLCDGIPQLDQGKIKYLWSMYVSKTSVPVRKVKCARIPGFGAAPKVVPEKSLEKETPQVVSLPKPTGKSPNVFAELKKQSMMEQKSLELSLKTAALAKPAEIPSTAQNFVPVPASPKLSVSFAKKPEEPAPRSSSSFFGSFSSIISKPSFGDSAKIAPVITTSAPTASSSFAFGKADAQPKFSFALPTATTAPTTSTTTTGMATITLSESVSKPPASFPGVGFVLGGSADTAAAEPDVKDTKPVLSIFPSSTQQSKPSETLWSPAALVSTPGVFGAMASPGMSVITSASAGDGVRSAFAATPSSSMVKIDLKETPTTKPISDASKPASVAMISAGFGTPAKTEVSKPSSVTFGGTTIIPLPRNDAAQAPPAFKPSSTAFASPFSMTTTTTPPVSSATSQQQPPPPAATTLTTTSAPISAAPPSKTTTVELLLNAPSASTLPPSGGLFGKPFTTATVATSGAGKDASSFSFSLTPSATATDSQAATTTTASSLSSFSFAMKPAPNVTVTSSSPFGGFGSAPAASAAAATTTSSSSVFGGFGSTSSTPSSSSPFGGFGASTSAVAAPPQTTTTVFSGFGSGPATVTSASQFGGFGGSAAPSTAVTSSSTSGFGGGGGGTWGAVSSATPAKSPFGSSAFGGFGTPQAAATTTAQTQSPFGGFGSTPAPAAAVSPFGGGFGSTPTATTTNANSLGSFTSSFGNAFGLGSSSSTVPENKNPFGGSTSFAAPSSGGGGSVFGGSATATTAASSIFGGSGGTSTGFGQTSPFGSSMAGGGAASAFGKPAALGTGFGQPPAFGSSPSNAFGGAPAFGQPNAFGGSPAFGAAPLFGGSPGGGASSPFGGTATAGSPTFGSLAASQDVPTFGSLSGSTGGGGFGGLGSSAGAQPVVGGNPGFGFGAGAAVNTGFGGFGQSAPSQQQQQQQQQSSFSGGSSFSSWR
ncbi:unnamed protein product [Notodromas monacha]|uniref:Nucleoporin Nup159/Nup146 N-terminal domain-containing protein n=1 Tax=Notodromas monacha TaxID=399045 RepID=A0A7R9GDW6_9CRUS|nr:unnamed protein product [Notodromas monacha]CAG0917645.1 unnamed protein product [Notodromas monacha]